MNEYKSKEKKNLKKKIFNKKIFIERGAKDVVVNLTKKELYKKSNKSREVLNNKSEIAHKKDCYDEKIITIYTNS